MADVTVAPNVLCTGVNDPDHPDYSEFNVAEGDTVGSDTYAPTKSDPDVGIEAGKEYNMFTITKQGSKAQAFIVWSPPDAKFQDALKPGSGKVYAVGASGQNNLKRGDRINIITKEGTTDLTFDWPGGTFSVVISR